MKIEVQQYFTLHTHVCVLDERITWWLPGDYNKIVVKCKKLESYWEENKAEGDSVNENIILLEYVWPTYFKRADKNIDIIPHYFFGARNLRKMDLAILKKPVRKVNFIDYSVQALLKVTVLLNPTVDSQTIVNNLLIIQQLKVCTLSPYFSYRLYVILGAL